jgi:hypothetical protein
MEPRTVARILALGRVAIGAALLLMPGRAGARWIGRLSRRPGAQVALAAVGARDVALGAGAAWSVSGGGGAKPWLLACAGSDLADLLATLGHRDALSRGAVVGVAALAGGSAAAGVWLARELD